jgi:signal transduction histidine kinase
VAEERARIARELHDVVAHALSVIVLQVGAVRRGLGGDDPEEENTLREVEQTGRQALGEMRRMVGAMRREGEDLELEPRSGLENLDGLLGQVRGAGLAVDLHVEGERRLLPAGIDLAAYRIVQEGLTNALKHANASHADVFVHYGARELELEVRDDGDGKGAIGNGRGYGLLGIRERVKVYGGEMSAEPRAEGGFALRSRLPLEDGSP